MVDLAVSRDPLPPSSSPVRLSIEFLSFSPVILPLSAMRLLPSSLVLLGSLVVSTAAFPTSPEYSTLSRRQSALVPPSVDPFYDPPYGYQRTKNGGVLKNRTVSTAFDQLSKAYQVLYKTTQADQDKPDATVATLFVPLKPVSPPRIMLYLSGLFLASPLRTQITLTCSPFCSAHRHCGRRYASLVSTDERNDLTFLPFDRLRDVLLAPHVDDLERFDFFRWYRGAHRLAKGVVRLRCEFRPPFLPSFAGELIVRTFTARSRRKQGVFHLRLDRGESSSRRTEGFAELPYRLAEQVSFPSFSLRRTLLTPRPAAEDTAPSSVDTREEDTQQDGLPSTSRLTARVSTSVLSFVVFLRAKLTSSSSF